MKKNLLNALSPVKRNVLYSFNVIALLFLSALYNGVIPDYLADDCTDCNTLVCDGNGCDDGVPADGVFTEETCSSCSDPTPGSKRACAQVFLDYSDEDLETPCAVYFDTQEGGNFDIYISDGNCSIDNCTPDFTVQGGSTIPVGSIIDLTTKTGYLVICKDGASGRRDMNFILFCCGDGDCNTEDIVVNTADCDLGNRPTRADIEECACEYEEIPEPNCDDGDCNTIDTYNRETCECEHEAIPPPNCDDNDCNTEDSYNYMTCECEHTPIPPPNCDDNDCNTEDSYNSETCECENTPIPPPNCDDNDCNTEDSYDAETCTCVNTPIPPPDCDDNDCNTEDSYDAETCTCVNTPIPPPDCNDNDCNTEDSYDAETCTCVNTPIPPPDCNDNDCNTKDYYDAETCTCINEPIPPPDCNDYDCNTKDYYDAETCTCINEPIDPPTCDDGDPCTVEFYDPTTCECVYTPIDCCSDETAYGGKGICFTDLGARNNKWGWVLGSIDCDDIIGMENKVCYRLYAGAAHCETSRGYDVGEVCVWIDKKTHKINIKYDLEDAYGYDFRLGTVHAWAGCYGDWPKNFAPGKFTSKGTSADKDMATVMIDAHYVKKCKSDFYLILHAEVEVCETHHYYDANDEPGSVIDQLENAQDLQTQDLTLTTFPNPASEYIQLDISGLQDGRTEVQLIDRLGRLIMIQRVDDALRNTQLRLELSSQITNGIYYIILRNGDQVKTAPVMVFKE